MGAAAVVACAGAASAGGVERSTQSVGILFEEGNYVELGFARVAPDVSGVQLFDALGKFAGASSGDMSDDYTTWSLGFKTDLSERISFALVIDEPIGADLTYGDLDYIYAPSTASLDSVGVTGMLRYKFDNQVSIYGGIRGVRTSGTADLFTGYSLTTSTETDFGYLVGIAWEKPEIAARVALTYNSAITHDFDAVENGIPTEFTTKLPESVNLEFQTGIAADTLLFGSVRWVNWTQFSIDPDIYRATAGGVFVDYESDTITYNLGVGRKFNDAWSGAITIGYEPANNDFAGNLGPTDGFTSVGLAVTHTRGNMKITAGARYVWIGDAETEAPPALAGATGVPLGSFKDNTAVAFGVRVGYYF
ncbi:long-subunit fatty acid transport protein [Rhodovulum marinum]|uniref:Long-subunit fatty acid transport protein n=2 Tax=Rhodovulum marinum TaxID=320662 RepID=A0A4R2Q2T6_9RHOB|nr:long-subunit fatty acid transport protein [Rhodovulum marinum]